MNALIKREFIYFHIKSPFALIIKLVVILFVSPSIVFQLRGFSSRLTSGMMVVELFAVMLILLIGTQSLAMQFYQEKLKRNIEVLLALGFSSFRIWLGKMITIWCVVYVLYVIGMVFAFGASRVIGFTNPYQGELYFYLIVFLCAPLIGFALLGLMGMLYLVLSDVRMVNLVTVFGAIIVLAFLPRVLHGIPATTLATSYFPVVSVLLAALLIGACWVVLRLVPVEKYL